MRCHILDPDLAKNDLREEFWGKMPGLRKTLGCPDPGGKCPDPGGKCPDPGASLGGNLEKVEQVAGPAACI